MVFKEMNENLSLFSDNKIWSADILMNIHWDLTALKNWR